jgi:hypothetical protein
MVLERDILPFWQWFLIGPQGAGAFWVFLFMIAVASLLAILFCYGLTAVRQGPVEAFYVVAQVIAGSIPDFIKTAPRRVLAMSRLAIKESFRRKVLVAFVVFAVLALYAGWFLDTKSDHPARLYLSFAMTATQFLVLLLSLFLSTFSLPNDIKDRTLYTVVTKPVRPFEIVLGRILGFAFVGTILLAMMGVVGYGFVVRNLSHTHELEATNEEIQKALRENKVWTGQTTENQHHRHEVRIEQGETGVTGEQGTTLAVKTDVQREHFHPVYAEGEGDAARFRVGPPDGQLLARVPVYGDLRFLSRSGGPGQGVNVGNEWTYRKYIEGGTLAAAIWTFHNVTPERFPDGLPLEMNIRIFRTYKGIIEQGVRGTLQIKSPNRSARINSSTPRVFNAKEFTIYEHHIPRKIQAIDSETSAITDVDLFDLAEGGDIEIWLMCAERNQYFGMAKADMFLRATDHSFAMNYVKGFVGIWLQMLVVICFGVMFSTFLSGPIALLATLSILVMGGAAGFVENVFIGMVEGNPTLKQILGSFFGGEDSVFGGGPIESLVRIVTQQNVMVELDMHWVPVLIIKSIDTVFVLIMMAFSKMLPDYSFFDTAQYVATGFDISGNLIAQQSLVTLAYVFSLTVAGYFFLKTREIAA